MQELEEMVTEPDGRNARRNISDCIDDLLSKPLSSLSRLHCEDGDTWLFIKPPAQEPEYNDQTYSLICERYDTPFKVRSSALKGSQSTVVLKQLESPTQQFRIIRRFGVKQEMQDKGIKFVVDLTPPIDGEEAVEIISELSCPPGILDWHHEASLFSIRRNLVDGNDEFVRDVGTRGRVLPVYTPLRHRYAIERVVLALHGQDPFLTSAPNLYTTVMTAVKHLGIPAHCLVNNLTDYVISWLRNTPNDLFIQFHPDVTLKIADSLQSSHLCQDAFSVLAGEAALDMVSQYNPALSRQEGLTVHNWSRASIDETWDTRIQYARDAIVERVDRFFFKYLVGGDMQWVDELPSVRSIPKFTHYPYMHVYNELIELLKSYVKGSIYHVLLSKYTRIPIADWCPISHQIITRAEQFKKVFNSLRSKERIFTRNFWLAIYGVSLTNTLHTRNVDVVADFNGSSSSSGEYKDQLNAGTFEEVPAQMLLSKSFELKKHATSRQISKEFVQATFPGKEVRFQFSSALQTNLPVRTYQQLPTEGSSSSATKANPTVAVSPTSTLGQISGGLPAARSSPGPEVSIKQEADLPFFTVQTFLRESEDFIARIANHMLQQPNDGSMDVKQIDTLLCLNSDEMRYLPLWAGGLDDGSSGAFNPEPPAIPEHEGFGPAKEGLSRSPVRLEAGFDDVDTTVGTPTIGTSRLVNDGQSVIMDRRQVYADDEVESTRHPPPSDAGTDSSWEKMSRDDMSVSIASDFSDETTQAASEFFDDHASRMSTDEIPTATYDFEMSDPSDSEEYSVPAEEGTAGEETDEAELI